MSFPEERLESDLFKKDTRLFVVDHNPVYPGGNIGNQKESDHLFENESRLVGCYENSEQRLENRYWKTVGIGSSESREPSIAVLYGSVGIFDEVPCQDAEESRKHARNGVLALPEKLHGPQQNRDGSQRYEPCNEPVRLIAPHEE